jgi:hypothetical protein
MQSVQPESSAARRIAALLAFVCAACLWVWASKEFVKPVAKPAASYPAHDTHSDEMVTAAADPYDLTEKAQIFSVHWSEEGFLPIFLVITNDGDQPVSLVDLQAQFITTRRDKISAASNEDLYRRLAHISGAGTSPLPLPIPRKPKGALSKKTQDEINAAQFTAKAVEPHSTQSGFLFFDVSGISAPEPGAHIYLTGLRNAKGTELMYFEIALEKYLAAPSKAN